MMLLGQYEYIWNHRIKKLSDITFIYYVCFQKTVIKVGWGRAQTLIRFDHLRQKEDEDSVKRNKHRDCLENHMSKYEEILKY